MAWVAGLRLVPRLGRTHFSGKFIEVAIAEADMGHGSVRGKIVDAQEQTRCHGMDVMCKYEVSDQTLSILLAIVREARKSEESHSSEVA